MIALSVCAALVGLDGNLQGMERLAFRAGYSVVMPRPFLKRPQQIGPAFLGVSDDRLYIVSSSVLSPKDYREFERAKQNGVQSLQGFLDAYVVTFTLEARTLSRDTGSFHGMPCLRRVFEAKRGERGALLAIFEGAKTYILICVNGAGEADFHAAQQFFDSFRIEKPAEKDPDLADPPPNTQYPPTNENSGIA